MNKCKFCNNEIIGRKNYLHPNPKYCSDKCVKEFWRFNNIPPKGKQNKFCVICKSAFLTSNFHPNQITCSIKCSSKSHYLKNKEKIIKQTKEWGDKNKEKLLKYQRIYYHKHLEKKRIQSRIRQRGHISYKNWYKICEDNDFRCQLCEEKFPFKELSIDHKIPISWGGGNELWNLWPMCLPCNQKKGARWVPFCKH